jgi:outer membrane protein
MKNGLLIWNVVLTIVTGYLLFAQFNKKESKKTDSKRISGPADSLAAPSPFRIAYFEMDSVENNFDLVKEVKAEIEKKEDAYNGILARIENDYQKKGMEYLDKKDKFEKGALSQAEYEKAAQEMRVMEDNRKRKRQEIDQEYQEFVSYNNLSIRKEIEDFLAKYNQAQNYSYIVAYEQGLFYYKDTAYNITADLIRGLNEEYKDRKKKK